MFALFVDRSLRSDDMICRLKAVGCKFAIMRLVPVRYARKETRTPVLFWGRKRIWGFDDIESTLLEHARS